MKRKKKSSLFNYFTFYLFQFNLLFRSSMNVSSQPLVLPTNHHHHHRFLTTTTHPSMFVNASPIAVSNKIKAIQARKTRLTLIPANNDYTDIRPLNFGYTGGVTHSRTDFSVLTAERLVDRSKDIRLDRISTRQPPRPSVLSSTSTNQQSLLWPNYQSSTGCNKQPQTQSNSTTVTPPATKNKSPGGKIPYISRHRNRQPLFNRQNSLTPIEPQPKSPIKKMPVINVTERTNHFPIHENDEDDENMAVDEEFEQYLEKAIVKCADWLIKYVFNEKSDENNN